MILTSQPPAEPAAVHHTGAYLPGIVPGAAAGQYGAPLAMPGGPVVTFGPGHPSNALRSPLDQGSGAISGKAVGHGPWLQGNADGS